MEFQHRDNCQTLPSFLSLLARISALTGAIALALEIMTPKRGQNTVVNHDMSDIWKFQLLRDEPGSMTRFSCYEASNMLRSAEFQLAQSMVECCGWSLHAAMQQHSMDYCRYY